MKIHQIKPRRDGKLAVTLKFDNGHECHWLHKVWTQAQLQACRDRIAKGEAELRLEAKIAGL